MALTDENGGMGTTMLVQPSGFNNGMGFGGDWSSWIIILLIFSMFGGGWGNGFGGGFGGGLGYDFPWLLNGQNGINANTNSGFDHLATQNMLGGIQNAVTSGFGDVQTALCSGFAGVNGNIANGFAQAEIAANGRQMANMNQNFGLQTAMLQGFNGLQSQFADCCCENRLASCQTQNIIQNEGNATRFADANNTRDLLTAFTSGIQSIKDQLCADKIDAKNDEIAQLRQEVLFARGQASQTAQNTAIINGVYNRLNECPVGTVPVYGEQPIFRCNNNGCGCGCGA